MRRTALGGCTDLLGAETPRSPSLVSRSLPRTSARTGVWACWEMWWRSGAHPRASRPGRRRPSGARGRAGGRLTRTAPAAVGGRAPDQHRYDRGPGRVRRPAGGAGHNGIPAGVGQGALARAAAGDGLDPRAYTPAMGIETALTPSPLGRRAHPRGHVSWRRADHQAPADDRTIGARGLSGWGPAARASPLSRPWRPRLEPTGVHGRARWSNRPARSPLRSAERPCARCVRRPRRPVLNQARPRGRLRDEPL